ncbi:hypothetical protein M3Y97_00365900 [Aphelenchoides bicaudatus]|nr:hypothetical protein M3Y97_00365900 [Aphelenchoides bicaudatus]
MNRLGCWSRLNAPLVYYFCCICPIAATVFQISPEKPIDFTIKACSHEKTPMEEDTMLFFPEGYKFCSALRTTKNVISLARDKQKTTYLQPLVQITLHEVGAPYKCKIDYLGYGGEYRLSPDLGYYPTCQKPINQYITQLSANVETPSWNVSTSNCPIQTLPSKYRDYLSCELNRNRWYELYYKGSIRYEVYHKRRYHQAWSNHTTATVIDLKKMKTSDPLCSFLFKPDNFVERNGSELDWLQRLVELQAKQKNCQKARYMIRVDEAWPLPITWFSGAFPIERSDRTHEVCIQLVWRGSMNRFRLCRTFLKPEECHFGTNSTQGLLVYSCYWMALLALFLRLLIN